jgi:hypothetical protein
LFSSEVAMIGRALETVASPMICQIVEVDRRVGRGDEGRVEQRWFGEVAVVFAWPRKGRASGR